MENKLEDSGAANEAAAPTTATTSAAAAAQERATTTAKPDDSQAATTSKSETTRPLPPLLNRENFNVNCMLLADTTLECVPMHLRRILQHYEGKKLTQAEMLFLLVYLVALECGYVERSAYNKYNNDIYKLQAISTFHLENVMRLAHVQPTYLSDTNIPRFGMQLYSAVNLPQTQTPNPLGTTLSAIISGELMILTLTPEDADSIKLGGHSVCLSMARYVLRTQSNGKPIATMFRRLDDLSLLLRRDLFMPMRQRQMGLLGAAVYPALQGLPLELYEEIFKYLPASYIKKLASVSRELRYRCLNLKPIGMLTAKKYKRNN